MVTVTGKPKLLRYICMTHDVGSFISRWNTKHSYYIIRNWDLLGFDDTEIEIIATAAMCHRKQFPRKVRSPKLSAGALRLTEVLASVVRIADALDRSQMGAVNEIICRPQPNHKGLALEIYASEDSPLEMWWLDSKKDLFEQTFALPLSAKLDRRLRLTRAILSVPAFRPRQLPLLWASACFLKKDINVKF